MKISALPIIAMCGLLSACGSNEKHEIFDQAVVTLEQACEKYSAFCANYTSDSMCRNERKNFLEGHYYFSELPNGKNAFSMLMLTQQYTKCAGKAKLIEYIPASTKYPEPESEMSEKRLKEKADYEAKVKRLKADKESNYRNAMHFLRKIEKQYEGYEAPQLLAYQWKYKSNHEAKDLLVQYYDEGKIDDIDMEFLVIGTFARYEPDRAIRDLLSLLRKYPKEQYFEKEENDDDPTMKMAYDDLGVLHFDIFRQLTTLYFNEQDYERAFIFALLLEMNNDVTANTQMILDYMREDSAVSDDKLDKLEDIADEIHDALDDGAFTPSFVSKV